MRRTTLALALLLAFAIAALAQPNVIKYELSAASPLTIGSAVKLGATDNTCALAADGEGNLVIGFVGMVERSGGNNYHLVVNSGRITSFVTEAVNLGDELTASTAGSLKVAGAGDRVVAIATQDAAANGDCEIMIMMEPMEGAGGAQIWQAAVAGTPVSITAAATGVQSVAQIDMTGTDCDVEEMKIQFTGTVDDKDGAHGGAVVNIDITATGTPGGGQLATQSVYLVDRNFYEREVVALTITQDVSPTDNPIYDVYIWETEGLTNGRVVEGILTVVGTPR